MSYKTQRVSCFELFYILYKRSEKSLSIPQPICITTKLLPSNYMYRLSLSLCIGVSEEI